VTEQLYVDDVRVGDRVPALDVTVDPTQMFFFSAATYNGHRIHYDRTWATEVEGYRDLLVHGPLQSALLARSITDWIGGRGRLVRLIFQNRAVAYPGDPMRFEGTVTAVDVESGTVELSVLAAKGEPGEVLMPGTATVRLPRRA
jgi:hydroxyacyl-ACP dehydratase HTD2-like protein with hotdog domain